MASAGVSPAATPGVWFGGYWRRGFCLGSSRVADRSLVRRDAVVHSRSLSVELLLATMTLKRLCRLQFFDVFARGLKRKATLFDLLLAVFDLEDQNAVVL